MPSFFQIRSFLHHWLLTVDAHSIHSPFFFDFYEKVILNKNHYPGFPELEAVRERLLQSTMEVDQVDLGAPSKHFTGSKRALSKIARVSASPVDHCELLYRMVQYLNATSILELGTSVGITTLYLARDPKAHVTTFEGNRDLINVAQTHFDYFQTRNIQLIEGNLDSTLSKFLLQPTKIHFALMDANHRLEPTLRYFQLLARRMAEKGVIVIDDIYYSEEMERAWKTLKAHELVYASVDLYRCGILFFDPALNRQHYIWSV